MSDDAISIARQAVNAFLIGDLATLRELVALDLSWTFLDPTQEEPDPSTCHGRANLEAGIVRWSSMGIQSELEEIQGRGDKVMIVVKTPGLDRFRARNANDRNFHVVTVRDGKVIALRACRDRKEACDFIGMPSDESTN